MRVKNKMHILLFASIVLFQAREVIAENNLRDVSVIVLQQLEYAKPTVATGNLSLVVSNYLNSKAGIKSKCIEKQIDANVPHGAKEYINRIFEKHKKDAAGKEADQIVDELKKVGREFNADYIVCPFVLNYPYESNNKDKYTYMSCVIVPVGGKMDPWMRIALVEKKDKQTEENLMKSIGTCVANDIEELAHPLPYFAYFPLDREQAKTVVQAAAKHYKISDVLNVDIGEATKMEFVLIPPGRYIQNYRENFTNTFYDTIWFRSRFIFIEQPFYMGKYEVTREQWEIVMKDKLHDEGEGNFPVTEANYEDCTKFCKKMSGLISRIVRLPDESEWEYACRAGTYSTYNWGNNLSPKYANYSTKIRFINGTVSPDSISESVKKIGSYPPNAWGLYDMHGNAEEWCDTNRVDTLGLSDLYGHPARISNILQVPEIETMKVWRGGSSGSFMEVPPTSTEARFVSPTTKNPSVGFRVIIPIVENNASTKEHDK